MEKFKSIYCRAKSIMNKEEDVLALMKEVYSLAEESNVAEENAEAWMIKQTYVLGCGKFRKKQAREAEIIELQEHEYVAQKGIERDKTKELICETLTELPDLYHATLLAFYYDQYSIKEVAAVTGYSVGAVINRLNYIHKYLSKTLEDYQEENKVKVQFSVEMVYEALIQWAVENTLEEDKPDVTEKSVETIKEELLAHSVKKGLDKKLVVLVGAIIGGLVILAIAAVLIVGSKSKKDDVKNQQSSVENQTDEDEEEEQIVLDDVEEESEEKTQEENTQEESQEEDSETASDSEYILPNSDTVRLTRSDLQGLSKEELRLARNEIFARHGMIFGVADLDAYFGAKSWYKPTVAFDDFYNVVEMSMIEEANVVLISEVEKEME